MDQNNLEYLKKMSDTFKSDQEKKKITQICEDVKEKEKTLSRHAKLGRTRATIEMYNENDCKIIRRYIESIKPISGIPIDIDDIDRRYSEIKCALFFDWSSNRKYN